MIKALAFDLDGTLLNKEKKLTLGVKKVLRELFEKGIEVLIVTGRPYSSTKETLRDLNLPIISICYNGGKIVDNGSGEIIVNKILPEDVAFDFLNYIKEKDIEINLFKDDVWYARSLDSYSTKVYAKNSGLTPEIFDLKEMTSDNLTKGVIVNSDDDFLNKHKKELENLLGDRAYITFTQAQYLEVLNKEINKGKALKDILDSKEIKLEECMAFGDSENDLEMIEAVGAGVAMKNAIPQLKNIAQYITEYTNNEDGIEKFLKEYFKGILEG